VKIVIDTNIVFSALLSKNNQFRRVIYNQSLEIFTCNFLFIEIFKNKDKLLKITSLTENELLKQLSNIFSKIKFMHEEIIPKEIYKKAFNLCKDIDETDTPFIALSLFLNIPLLTGDKKLKIGLKGKGFKNIISVDDLNIHFSL